MNIRLDIYPRAQWCALTVVLLAACTDRGPGAGPQAHLPSAAPQATIGTAPTDPLPPEQAFKLQVDPLDGGRMVARFSPAPDHYLYKSRMSFTLKAASGVQLDTVTMPAGVPKKDPYFGDQEVYRQPVQITLPLVREAGKPAKFTLVATYQGCNERIGLCYPPIETPFDFSLP